MAEPRLFKIIAEWDPEASVWVVTSDDVPGLATEAETWEQVLAKLRVLVPELLELNGVVTDSPTSVPLDIVSHREEVIELHPQ